MLAAQNKETQNLQKKSILLDLSSAVTIVGVDVTITNKTPLKTCTMYVSGAFQRAQPEGQPLCAVPLVASRLHRCLLTGPSTVEQIVYDVLEEKELRLVKPKS